MTDKVKAVEIDQVREKLIELHQHDNCPLFMVFGELEALVDYLIANGVTVQKWIPVTERLPEEHDSIFARFYGTERWTPGMFHTLSNYVVVCLEYSDGTRGVNTLYTKDGKWDLSSIWQAKVTHWMPMPEPPKEAAT